MNVVERRETYRNESGQNSADNLGEYVKARRKALRISQKFLSDKCGISTSEINRIECGLRFNPNIDVIKRLADGLEVSPIELLKHSILLSHEETTHTDFDKLVENMRDELVDVDFNSLDYAKLTYAIRKSIEIIIDCKKAERSERPEDAYLRSRR